MLIMSDGVEIYTEKKGMGEICIFIHGGPGEGSLNFQRIAGEYMEKDFTMIYYDQRGCCRSKGGFGDDYSIDRMVEDIEEIRVALGGEKVTLLAHSFGGIIGASYTRKYGKNVKRLILANATLDLSYSLRVQTEYGRDILGLEDMREGGDLLSQWHEIFTLLMERGIYQRLQYVEIDNHMRLSEIGCEVSEFNNVLGSQAFNNAEYFKDFRNICKDIDIDVLIVTGDEDYAVGPNHHMEFNFKNSRLVTIKGKHMLYMEQKEEFKRALKDS